MNDMQFQEEHAEVVRQAVSRLHDPNAEFDMVRLRADLGWLLNHLADEWEIGHHLPGQVPAATYLVSLTILGVPEEEANKRVEVLEYPGAERERLREQFRD